MLQDRKNPCAGQTLTHGFFIGAGGADLTLSSQNIKVHYLHLQKQISSPKILAPNAAYAAKAAIVLQIMTK